MAIAFRTPSASGDHGDHALIDRVYLYPHVPDTPPDLDPHEWKDISRAIEDFLRSDIEPDFVVNKVIFMMMKNASQIGEIDEIWWRLGKKLYDLLPEQKRYNISNEMITRRFDNLYTVLRLRPWMIDDFVKDISKLPSHFGDNRIIDESNIHTLLTSCLEYVATCIRPLSYSYVYGYLLHQSGRQEWLEEKYRRRSSLKKLHLILHVPARKIAKEGELDLIALDDRAIRLIRSGKLDGMSSDDIREHGDFIESAEYRYLENINSCVAANKALAVERGLFLRPIGNECMTPLERYAKVFKVNHSLYGKDIDPKIIINSVDDPLEIGRLLDLYVKEHPGEPVGYLAFQAFKRSFAYRQEAERAEALSLPVNGPRVNDVPLPNEPPEVYPGLRGPESPPMFVKRVYGPWLGKGLDRAHIRKLDPKLSVAINNWLSREGNTWPLDVDLPTRGEQNKRTIDRLQSQAPDGKIGKVLGDFTAREAGRIRSAFQRAQK